MPRFFSNIQSQRARLPGAVAAKARRDLPESDNLRRLRLTARGKRIEQRERHENPPRLPPTHGTVVRLSDYTSTCWLNGRQCEQTVGDYSYLSATIGSMRIARRAGI